MLCINAILYFIITLSHFLLVKSHMGNVPYIFLLI